MCKWWHKVLGLVIPYISCAKPALIFMQNTCQPTNHSSQLGLCFLCRSVLSSPFRSFQCNYTLMKYTLLLLTEICCKSVELVTIMNWKQYGGKGVACTYRDAFLLTPSLFLGSQLQSVPLTCSDNAVSLHTNTSQLLNHFTKASPPAQQHIQPTALPFPPTFWARCSYCLIFYHCYKRLMFFVYKGDKDIHMINNHYPSNNVAL